MPHGQGYDGCCGATYAEFSLRTIDLLVLVESGAIPAPVTPWCSLASSAPTCLNPFPMQLCGIAVSQFFEFVAQFIHFSIYLFTVFFMGL